MTVFLLILAGCSIKPEGSAEDLEILTGDYLGQPVPGDSAVLFAEGLVCTGMNERDASFTPEGDEFYYTICAPQGIDFTIMVVRRSGGIWSQPETAPFSGVYSDIEPFVSPDGKQLFFASNRPLDSTGNRKDFDIWMMERMEDGRWCAPFNIGDRVNTEKDEFYPSVSSNGNLYFTATLEIGLGGEDIYVSKYVNGEYSEPENLGGSVNSPRYEFNAFIAPDESYLLFSSYGREDGFGGGDLYITHNEDGNWSEAKNLGDKVNTSALDFCPYVTSDGAYLFFSRNRYLKPESVDAPRAYKDLVIRFNSPQNGLGDIYWIKTDTVIK